MKLMEDVFLTDAIEIRTTPEKIFDFISNLVDEESYRAFHPDHVTMRWIEGAPWQKGSIVYAEQYLHEKLHQLKLIVTKVVPNKRIEYAPVSWFLRRYVPKMSFSVESKGENCIFTATAHYRLALLLRLLAKKSVKKGLSSVRKHMKEEGENLKQILEAEGKVPNPHV